MKRIRRRILAAVYLMAGAGDHAAVDLVLTITGFPVNDRLAIHAIDEVLVELLSSFPRSWACALLIPEDHGCEKDGCQPYPEYQGS